MASRLAAAAAHLSERLQDYESVAVTYRRGSDSVTFDATIGSSLLKVTDPGSGAVRIIRTDRDFLFPAALLILATVQVEPARGDYIDETTASVTRRYQVLPPGGDEPAFKYSDRERTLLRVHTKYIGTV